MEKFTLYDKNILDELYEETTIKESLDLDDLLKLPVNEEYKNIMKVKNNQIIKDLKKKSKQNQLN